MYKRSLGLHAIARFFISLGVVIVHYVLLYILDWPPFRRPVFFNARVFSIFFSMKTWFFVI